MTIPLDQYAPLTQNWPDSPPFPPNLPVRSSPSTILFPSMPDINTQNSPDSPLFSPNFRVQSLASINLFPSMSDLVSQSRPDSPPFPPNVRVQSSPSPILFPFKSDSIAKKSIKQLKLPMKQKSRKRFREKFSGTIKVTVHSQEEGSYTFTPIKSSTTTIPWTSSSGELACSILHKIIDKIQRQHPSFPINIKCLFKPEIFEVDITPKLRKELMVQYFDFLRTNRLDKAERCLKLVESISTYALRSHLSYSSSHSWHKK